MSGTTESLTELATFGGGCFWCVEAVFKQLAGVEKVASGYSGGHMPSPSYEQVSGGTTGHAESIQISFDPVVISYEQLLAVFFATHDPTTADQQGADVGTQYRSAIFYHTDEQKRVAENMIRELTSEKTYPGPIVTQIVPYKKFYRAEDYHQDYYAQNQDKPYCMLVINPKLAKLREKFAPLLKK